MTTIAYSHKYKEVAVDSRMSEGGLIVNDKTDKTFKNDRGLWVFCGRPSGYKSLANLKHNDRVDSPPNCSALLIRNNKCYCVTVDSDGYCMEDELTEDYTRGSGAEFALAAMDFGKTTKEAVSYAKTRDMHTGGKVRVFKV